MLVHCFAGVSRSSTCVIAYLMQVKKMSFVDAFTFVRSKRSIAFPNIGFQRQLAELDAMLSSGKQSVPRSAHPAKNAPASASAVRVLGDFGQHSRRHKESSHHNALRSAAHPSRAYAAASVSPSKEQVHRSRLRPSEKSTSPYRPNAIADSGSKSSASVKELTTASPSA